MSQAFADLVSTDTYVQYLSLRGNRIDNSGMKVLAQAFMRNGNISTLNLFDNDITDEGVGYLAQSLRYNRALQAISLAHNRVTRAGVIYFLETIRGGFIPAASVDLYRSIENEMNKKRNIMDAAEKKNKKKKASSAGSAGGSVQHASISATLEPLERSKKAQDPNKEFSMVGNGKLRLLDFSHNQIGCTWSDKSPMTPAPQLRYDISPTGDEEKAAPPLVESKESVANESKRSGVGAVAAPFFDDFDCRPLRAYAGDDPNERMRLANTLLAQPPRNRVGLLRLSRCGISEEEAMALSAAVDVGVRCD